MIHLSDMVPLPLREQIVRQVRGLILSGRWPEHTQLPSIRRLAQEQRVGVVTVQRAFEDLEREKIIYARQGKGYFVAPIDDSARRSQARGLALEALRGPLREARDMGLDEGDIETIVRRLLGEKE